MTFLDRLNSITLIRHIPFVERRQLGMVACGHRTLRYLQALGRRILHAVPSTRRPVAFVTQRYCTANIMLDEGNALDTARGFETLLVQLHPDGDVCDLSVQCTRHMAFDAMA